MSKYGESVGKWELKVGGFDKELKPVKGDARKFLKLLTESREKGVDFLFDQFELFIKDLIKRDYPPLNKAEEDELDMYIEYNLSELLVETQIRFRFITRAEVLQQKKDLLQTQGVAGIGTQKKKSTMQRQQGLNLTG